MLCFEQKQRRVAALFFCSSKRLFAHSRYTKYSFGAWLNTDRRSVGFSPKNLSYFCPKALQGDSLAAFPDFNMKDFFRLQNCGAFQNKIRN